MGRQKKKSNSIITCVLKIAFWILLVFAVGCGKKSTAKEDVMGTTKEYDKEFPTEEIIETPTIIKEDRYWEYSRTGLKISINRYDEDGIVYWVANVYTKNPDEDINTMFAGGSYDECFFAKETVANLAKKENAIFAVNGDAVGFRGAWSKYRNPLVIRNGELCYEDDRNIGEMCALKDDGELIVFSPGDLGNGEKMIKDGITDVWWFDCALVKRGKVVPGLYNVEESLKNAPYTAIGQKDKNNFIFIVVDGRGSNGSKGVSYVGMAELMERYGAYTAYQLDGGGSSTIWFDGVVLNKPSDGREREISDIIYVKR